VSTEKNPGLMIALVIVAVTVSTAVMVVGMWGRGRTRSVPREMRGIGAE
jgi:hypothetical protein